MEFLNFFFLKSLLLLSSFAHALVFFQEFPFKEAKQNYTTGQGFLRSARMNFFNSLSSLVHRTNRVTTSLPSSA